jgi:hypothetical protein
MKSFTRREIELIKALRIYDDCMEELSFYVGHTRSRVGVEAGNRAEKVCRNAMRAHAILVKHGGDEG